MDDIRRPYRGERRDYALPTNRPAPATPQPHHPSHHPQPVHHTPTIPVARPDYQPPVHQPAHHAQPVAHHKPTRRRVPRVGLNKSVILATVLAGAAVFGGYLLLKPDKTTVFTPAILAQRSGFSFYYPSPLPAGYSYVNNINAFQDGQAYYMLGNGDKHIVVHEQASHSSKLDTKSLSNPVSYEAAGGQAALGSVTGQPAGLVLTGSTLITINTTGKVAPADVAAVINHLRLVNH